MKYSHLLKDSSCPNSVSIASLAGGLLPVANKYPLPQRMSHWYGNAIVDLALYYMKFLQEQNFVFQTNTTFDGPQEMSVQDMLNYINVIYFLHGRNVADDEIDIIFKPILEEFKSSKRSFDDFLNREDGLSEICGGIPFFERGIGYIYWKVSPSWVQNPKNSLKFLKPIDPVRYSLTTLRSHELAAFSNMVNACLEKILHSAVQEYPQTAKKYFDYIANSNQNILKNLLSFADNLKIRMYNKNNLVLEEESSFKP